jgi:hypothetical protein
VRHGPAPEKNDVELILGKGGIEGEELLSLIDRRRRVAGLHELSYRLNSTFGPRNRTLRRLLQHLLLASRK